MLRREFLKAAAMTVVMPSLPIGPIENVSSSTEMQLLKIITDAYDEIELQIEMCMADSTLFIAGKEIKGFSSGDEEITFTRKLER